MTITRIFSQIPRTFFFVLLCAPLFAQQCQITSPLPIPITISGCQYNPTLPGGSTSYIQHTNSLQSGATFSVSSGTVAGQLSPTSIKWPDGTVQVSSPSAGGGGGTPGGGDLEVQYNQAGSFGGYPTFAYDYVHGRLGIGATPSAFQLEITSDTAAGGFVGELIQNFKANGNMGLIEEDNTGEQVQYGLASTAFGAPLQSNAYIYTANVGLEVFMSGSNSIDFWTNAIERMSITSAGALNFQGSSAPPDSQALCLLSGSLGHCTTAVGVTGGCTCSVP